MKPDSVSQQDHDTVRELLGREPQGEYEIVVRHQDGTPRVIKNAPLLADGRPMPTRFWLVSPHDRLVVSRLESCGGVGDSQKEIDPEEIKEAHRQYRQERDAAIPVGYTGHRPSAGVGGTRIGVKCLHAHWANFLAGGYDPVGQWVEAELEKDPSGYRNTREG